MAEYYPNTIEARVEYLDSSKPGSTVKLDEHQQLLAKYFYARSPFDAVISSYNEFLEKLKYVIQNTVFELPNGEVRLQNLVFSKPARIGTFDNDGNKEIDLYPHKALRLGISYHSDVYTDIVFTHSSNPIKNAVKTKTHIFKLPVMVRSVLCNILGKTDRELVELGEDVSELGGYFVVSGKERIIIMHDSLKFNNSFIFPKKKDSIDIITNTMTCYTSKGTQSVNIVINTLDKTLSLQLSFLGIADGKSKIYRTMAPLLPFTFYGMKYKDDRLFDHDYIRNMILKMVKPEWRNKVNPLITISLGTIENDPYAYISRISKREEKYKKDKDNLILDINKDMEREFFPQISDSNIEYINKLNLYSIMLARSFEYLANLRDVDDRDSWGNKRLNTPGKALEQLFISAWRNVNNLIRQQTYTYNSSIDDIFRNMNIINGLSEVFNESILKDNSWSSSIRQGRSFKEGMTMTLDRSGSILLPYGLINRIVTSTNKQQQQPKIRDIHATSYGFICPEQTPENDMCGISKMLTILATVTTESPYISILEQLKINNYLQQEYDIISSTPLLINGKFIGWTDGIKSQSFLRKMRRKNLIPVFTSIVYHKEDRILYVHTDGARPVRPLMVVGKNGRPEITNKNLWNASFTELLEQGAVEYIDAFEQEYNSTVAESFGDLRDRIKDVKERRDYINVRSTQSKKLLNEGKVSEAKNASREVDEAVRQLIKILVNPYSHVELDPTSIYGINVSTIPQSNFSQSPRLTFGSKMLEAALGHMASNFVLRNDGVKMLMNPSLPIFKTHAYDVLGLDKFPAGNMILAAYGAVRGYNQDDSIVINRSAVDMGFANTVKYIPYKAAEGAREGEIEKIGVNKEMRMDPISGKLYDHLADDGLPSIGQYLNVGDIVVAKYLENKSTKKKRINNLRIEDGDAGFVDSVIVNQGGGLKIVEVKIRVIRRVTEGDKFATRYAQKGTIGLMLSSENMLFTQEGITPTMIYNPHSIPSRMTISQLNEMLASTLGVDLGSDVIASPFRPFQYNIVTRLLKMRGFSPSGEMVFINPETGLPMTTKLFMGPIYVQTLKHQVSDKIQARAYGAYNIQNHQPVRGRKRKGGIKTGEMEKDTVLAYGATSFLNDMMCYSSDAYTSFYCKNCGTIAIANALKNDYLCRRCDEGSNRDIVKVVIPYPFKSLTHLMHATGVDLRVGIQDIAADSAEYHYA